MPSPSSSPRSWGSSIFHRLRLRLLRWRSKFHYLLASLREYSPLYQWCIFASHPALGPYSYDFGFLCDVSYKLTTWTQNLLLYSKASAHHVIELRMFQNTRTNITLENCHVRFAVSSIISTYTWASADQLATYFSQAYQVWEKSPMLSKLASYITVWEGPTYQYGDIICYRRDWAVGALDSSDKYEWQAAV